jgi:hypothetical protein
MDTTGSASVNVYTVDTNIRDQSLRKCSKKRQPHSGMEARENQPLQSFISLNGGGGPANSSADFMETFTAVQQMRYNLLAASTTCIDLPAWSTSHEQS